MSQATYPSVITDEPDWKLHWQMSNADRLAISGILARLKPCISIEVGCYKGGSLQVISHYSTKVHSLDIDPRVAALGNEFSNVEFHIGSSRDTLPALIEHLNKTGQTVEFVLVDGDHSSEGVRSDINSLLRLNVDKRLVILMHDPFNPDCRHGIRTADWAANPYVQYVELDFTVGNFHSPAHDTATEGSMWGGLACAILDPWERNGELVIGQRQQAAFEAVFARSCYATPAPTLTRRIARKLKSKIGRLVGR
jgi:cephalosporin hydroxylase